MDVSGSYGLDEIDSDDNKYYNLYPHPIQHPSCVHYYLLINLTVSIKQYLQDLYYKNSTIHRSY